MVRQALVGVSLVLFLCSGQALGETTTTCRPGPGSPYTQCGDPQRDASDGCWSDGWGTKYCFYRQECQTGTSYTMYCTETTTPEPPPDPGPVPPGCQDCVEP